MIKVERVIPRVRLFILLLLEIFPYQSNANYTTSFHFCQAKKVFNIGWLHDVVMMLREM